jgi:hypothetical protein
MRSTKGWAALGAGLLLTTGLTACGTGDGGTAVEDDPKTALSEAVEALGDDDGIELTFAVDGDRDAIVAASDGEVTAEDADLVLDSSMVLRAAGEDENDAQAEFVVNVGGADVVEVRIVPEQRFFARVDLDAIGDVVDDPGFAEGVDEAVAQAEAFGLGELATAVRSGDWIELKGVEQLTEFAEGMSGEQPQEEELTEEDVEDVRARIVDALQRFLDEDVDVAYVGEESAGQRVTATTTQADLTGLFDEIAAVASDLGGVDPETLGADVPEASDDPVELDFWIADGRLSQVGFDLAQTDDSGDMPEGTYMLAAVAEFDGSVEAPAEATEIDLFAIVGNVLGGAMGGDLGGGSGADDGTDGTGEGDPLAQCFTEEELDEMTGGDEAARAELDAAIELGVIEVC